MNAVRREIMPGVALTCVKTDKCKTGCLSITLLTQLSRETAAHNALLPMVLRRGTASLPDMESIAARLDMLYGARVEPQVRKLGEIQAWGFYADFADEAWVPAGAGLLEGVAALMGEMLLSPNTRGGLLLPAYVDSEREKLLERIRGRINDKRSYSLERLVELMCFSEPYAVSGLGDEETAESIGYQKLTRHYREMLAVSPVEVFYCGSGEPARVERVIKETLLNLPRGEIDYEMGTEVRLNALEAEPRYFTEELDVTQGKLAIGWRLGESMEDPDMAALRVFNAVYGGAVTSKLFENVREKLSLCYFASSKVDVHKGIMMVSSGIDFDKYDAAKSEIFAQLEAIRQGQVTDQELEYAKRSLASDLRGLTDSPYALEWFYLDQAVDGLDCGPEELAALCEEVTRDDVVAIARNTECDAVYFLQGIRSSEEETE